MKQRKNAPCTIRLFSPSDSWSNILSRPRSTKCADDNGQSSTLIISLLSALYPHIPFILKFLLSSNSLISSYLDVLITPHVSDVPHFIVVAPSPLAPVGLCLLPSARSCFKHHLLALLNHLLVALLYHQIMFSHLCHKSASPISSTTFQPTKPTPHVHYRIHPDANILANATHTSCQTFSSSLWARGS